MNAFLPRRKSMNILASAGRDDKKHRQLREMMVQRQIVARGVKDEKILSVLRSIPRHLFVPPDLQSTAYQDYPLPIGQGQTISQPYIVALMTQLLEVARSDKVLEIGTGSGYQAAVLAELAREVTSVEIHEALAKHARELLNSLGYANVHVLHADGNLGWPENAPYDKILVTAAPSKIPRHLVEQLREGGKLVAPVGDYFQELIVLTKTATGVEQQSSIPVRFVPMVDGAEEDK